MDEFLDNQIKSLEEQRARAIEIVSQAFGAIQALNAVKNHLKEQAEKSEIEKESVSEAEPLPLVD